VGHDRLQDFLLGFWPKLVPEGGHLPSMLLNLRLTWRLGD
jgi:hypothetical protein